jgi:hypothetical protein
MPYTLPASLARCFADVTGERAGRKGERCERALAQKAELRRAAWCSEGIIDTGKIKVVYAISDIHGDGGFFMYWLVRSGLARYDDEKGWQWTSKKSALVVCGDVSDDYRGGQASDDAALLAANFEGFRGAPSGSGTWNVLAFINYLVAECDARIVVVLGNHELMNVKGAAENYKRKVTSALEEARGGWRAGGGMRELLGTPLVAACAGSLLFMHAEPPIYGESDVLTEFGGSHAAKEFTLRVNARARDDLLDGQVELALWGRSLGSELASRPRACGTFRLMMPGVTLVRGHCPNRQGAPVPPELGLVFGPRAASQAKNAAARLASLSGCAPHARVYAASGPGDLDDGSARGAYAGVVVSCAHGKTFDGAVFRIDCMGSLAFDISARLCSVVAFDVEKGEVFCLVGTREAN